MSFSQLKSIMAREVEEQQQANELQSTTSETDEQMFQRLLTNVRVDTSASSAMAKGFASAKSLTRAAADVAAVGATALFPESNVANFMAGRTMWRDTRTGELAVPYYMGPEELYGYDWRELNNDEKRERIKRFDAEQIDTYYGGVVETASPVASGVGTLGGLIADPTTLTPIGTTWKAAAAIGGGLGATDAVLQGLAAEGKVDMEMVLYGTLLGAGVGVVVQKAGDMFQTWLKDRIARGQPISAKEVVEFNPKQITVDEAETLANAVNGQFKLSEKSFLRESIKRANTLPKGNEVALFEQRLAAAGQDDIAEKELQQLANLDKEFKLNFGDKFTTFKEKGPISPDDIGLKEKRIPFRPGEPRKGAIAKEDKLIAKRSDSDSLDIINKRERGLAESFADYIKRSKQSGEASAWLLRDLALATAGGLWGYSGDGDVESAMMWAIGSVAGMHAAETLGPKLYNQVGKLSPYTQQVTEELADKWVRRTLAHKWRQRPSEYFKEVAGDIGGRFNELVQKMDEDIRSMMSNDLIDVDNTLNSLGIKRGSNAYKNVTEVLRNPKLLKDVDRKTQAAVGIVREKFDNVVEQAVKRGVITKEAGAEMIAKAKKEGYFPRIYNDHYLMKAKGRKHWNEVLSEYEWTPQQIERAAKGILGEDYKYKYTQFKQVKDKHGNVKYKLDKEFINQLYRNKSKVTFSNRSTHLEKDRKLDLPDEVLEPFLINDLKDVLASYLHDTYKRINAAKYFGAKDEIMFKLQDEMKSAGISSSDINDMWSVYKTAAGNPSSWSIKQMMEMPHEMRSVYSKLSALQTVRLMMAQILNSSQAIVNSMIFLSTRAPGGLQREVIGGAAGFGVGEALDLETPSKIALAAGAASAARSGRFLLKGLGKTITKKGREFAQRIGAASEATIMEVAGEMGALESRMATGFLKWTGFTGIEKFNRILAANIGQAYAEEIVERKALLLSKQARGKLGQAGIDEIKKLNSQMKEIGLDPTVSKVNEIATADMYRAAQRFSNKVNFINTPDRLPFIAQSPHAKIFRQFKTFMFHQGAFLNDNLLKPLIKNKDARPIIALAAAGGLGMAPSELRKWLRGDDENYTMIKRYLQGFVAVGSLGLLFDLAQQGAYGEGAIATAILGPTFATFGKAIAGGARSVQQSFENRILEARPFGQSILNFPILGQALDIGTAVEQAGELFDIDLSALPSKQDMKDLTSMKKAADPYNYYNNIYK